MIFRMLLWADDQLATAETKTGSRWTAYGGMGMGKWCNMLGNMYFWNYIRIFSK